MRMLIIVSMSLALLVAGCRSGPQPQGDVEAVRLSKEPKLAPPPHGFMPPHARAIPDFDAVGLPNTARTFAAFKRVRMGMLLTEVIKVCGLPDGDLSPVCDRTQSTDARPVIHVRIASFSVSAPGVFSANAAAIAVDGVSMRAIRRCSDVTTGVSTASLTARSNISLLAGDRLIFLRPFSV